MEVLIIFDTTGVSKGIIAIDQSQWIAENKREYRNDNLKKKISVKYGIINDLIGRFMSILCICLYVLLFKCQRPRLWDEELSWLISIEHGKWFHDMGIACPPIFWPRTLNWHSCSISNIPFR